MKSRDKSVFFPFPRLLVDHQILVALGHLHYATDGYAVGKLSGYGGRQIKLIE
jgi:hypothetical protein